AGILKYVEDLKRGSNAEVGPKDYFEIASKNFASPYPGIIVPPDTVFQCIRKHSFIVIAGKMRLHLDGLLSKAV
ncbi:MAG: hypothetical protein C0611_04565, partial [Desulfobacteraceae bacterium]